MRPLLLALVIIMTSVGLQGLSPAYVRAFVGSPSSRAHSLAVGSGDLAVVAGTGDCLRLHIEPALAAAVVTCVPDGAFFIVTDGPRQADGYRWYKLRDLGWVVTDYLVAVSSTASLASRQIPLSAPPAFAALLDDAAAWEQDSALSATLDPLLNQAVTALGRKVFTAYAGDCGSYAPAMPNPGCAYVFPQSDGTVLVAFILPRTDAPAFMVQFVQIGSGWSPTFAVTGCGVALTAGPNDCFSYPSPL